jgi:hypothetical protein
LKSPPFGFDDVDKCVEATKKLREDLKVITDPVAYQVKHFL